MKGKAEEFKNSPLFDFLVNKCGGNYWDKNNNSRVYFNSWFIKYMLQIDWVYDNATNNLTGITLLGDTIPLEKALPFMNSLPKVKLFYSAHSKKVYVEPWSIPTGYTSVFCDLVEKMQTFIDTNFEKGGQAREG